ncbi:MAG: HIRAN domain-containing protein [Gammaproteobacteria bacterium]|nr:HIRAN domain-containing protein [Gammaproteobacteria bacterium]
MERRSFLNSIFAAAATLPFVGRARAAGQSHEFHERGAERELLIQESPVAGFQYHDGESVWSRLSAGDSIELLREPANPYDRRAVAVYWGESKLGYVPRAANSACCQMLDRGERLTARIKRLRESPDPWKRVELSIAARIAV